MTEHANLTGADAYHPSAYYQSSDPGAVGAGKNWIDTTTAPVILKRRNTGNTDWDTVLDPRTFALASAMYIYQNFR